MRDETQHKLGGAFQAAVERFADLRADSDAKSGTLLGPGHPLGICPGRNIGNMCWYGDI